jgi:trehalose synthase
MELLHEVFVPERPAGGLEPVIGAERYARLTSGAAKFRDWLGRRTVWNVNSTAAGGGVAEMLEVLVGYATGLDLAVRWMVIGGDPEFFAITKRLHNQIHGVVSEAGMVGTADDAAHYDRVLTANAAELLKLVRPGDFALLHDPQTAGLAAPLARAGVQVVWRSHVGVDWRHDATRGAWAFLRPYLAPARGYVFSRRQYVPSRVPEALTWIIPPSIDPLSAKNQERSSTTVQGGPARPRLGRWRNPGPGPRRHGCLVARPGRPGRIRVTGAAPARPPGCR